MEKGKPTMLNFITSLSMQAAGFWELYDGVMRWIFG